MRRPLLLLLLAYVALVAWSDRVRDRRPDPPTSQPSLTFRSDPAAPGAGRPLTLAWREAGSSVVPGRWPVVVLHGSPGDAGDLDAFARALARQRRVLVPDLPGGGWSTRRVADYSYVAQAARIRAWLAALGVARVHMIGFSMGGGAAITLASAPGERWAPAAVSSLTLLSSIGVQPMELFGRHGVNHAVHGAQLALLWLVAEGTPHFGALDDAMLGVPYARTFFDSDQRPLARRLASLEVPVLVVHGREDSLVPMAAAREHARLVPQAELHELDTDHFLVTREPARAASLVDAFLARVESGRQPMRRDAAPERVRAAVAPFDARTIPPAGLVAQLVLVLALALATLVSEDAACILAGVLVAHGQIGFALGVLGCVGGIAVGDAAIYGLGRGSARLLAARWPVRRLAARPGVAAAADWLRTSGVRALGVSRFVPGTRVVTCFAAGAVGLPASVALPTIVLAALAWTPLLVGLSVVATRWSVAFLPQHGALLAAGLGLLPWIGWKARAGRPLRRRLAGWWMRVTRWEFWPPWVVYVPVVLLVLPQAVRRRSLTVFTAANPGMPASGFVGESKVDILTALADGGAPVAPFIALDPAASECVRIGRARRFLGEHGLPVVLKPDQGQRGAGVQVLRTQADVESSVAALRVLAVLQAFVDGAEFGVFYARRPHEPAGRITSLTIKRLPTVTGDGVRTLAHLIDDDPRATALAHVYFRLNAARLAHTPASGERVQIAELGSHCRGAIFLDGSGLRSAALDAAVERAARAMPGFHFGRFDVRAPDGAALADGRFTILELNGVTSEPTHVYDPSCSLGEGLRALVAAWALAFEIGALNAADGARVWSPLELLELVRGHMRFRAARDAPVPRAWPPARVGAREAGRESRC